MGSMFNILLLTGFGFGFYYYYSNDPIENSDVLEQQDTLKNLDLPIDIIKEEVLLGGFERHLASCKTFMTDVEITGYLKLYPNLESEFNFYDEMKNDLRHIEALLAQSKDELPSINEVLPLSGKDLPSTNEDLPFKSWIESLNDKFLQFVSSVNDKIPSYFFQDCGANLIIISTVILLSNIIANHFCSWYLSKDFSGIVLFNFDIKPNVGDLYNRNDRFFHSVVFFLTTILLTPLVIPIATSIIRFIFCF